MGGGKSYWLCQEALRLSLQFPTNRIYMFRETLRDFKNSTLISLLEVLPSAIIKDVNRSECFVRLINGSVIHWAGFSEQRKDLKEKKGSMECGAFMIDEAHETSRDDFMYMQSRLRWKLKDGARPPYYGLLATNPADCWIKDDFILNPLPNYHFIKALPSDNPHLPEDYVDTLKTTWQDRPNMVAKFLEGNWDVFIEGVVLTREVVEAAVERDVPLSGEIVIGCDVAVSDGDNADETVITVLHGYKVIEVLMYTGKDIDITASRCALLYHKYKAKRVMIDDVGVGRGVSVNCENMGLNVYRIVGGESSSDFFAYRNKKTEMWWHARQLFQEGKVSIPNDEKLIRQLSAVKYDSNDRQISLETKKEAKKRLGWSPDRADSLIYALWGAQGTAGPEVEYFRRIDKESNKNAPLIRPVNDGFHKNEQPTFGLLR